MWIPYNKEETISQVGTENGIIIKDEEHSAGARITLEKGGYAPYAITCGIYGLMFHTSFAGEEKEAYEKYEMMKQDIDAFLSTSHSEKEISNWCGWFTTKY